MVFRRAGSDEMLRLWGYEDAEGASPTARYFCRNIDGGNALFWTVDDDGELIGELYAFLDIEEDRDFADGKETAYLCAFRIRKDFRGNGLGTRLMETVLGELKNMGFRRATIGVDDERNERLYRRLGFVSEVNYCHTDPCARDEDMQPVREEEGYRLLAKDL